MNRLRSAFLARSPTFFSMKAASIAIVSPDRSGAEKLTSSSTRSITVCRRRAPIFSTVALTSAATRASALIASSVKASVDALGAHQRDILLDEARFGLGEDAAEIVFGQRGELDPDRQAALQFGQKIGGPRRHERRPRR